MIVEYWWLLRLAGTLIVVGCVLEYGLRVAHTPRPLEERVVYVPLRIIGSAALLVLLVAAAFAVALLGSVGLLLVYAYDGCCCLRERYQRHQRAPRAAKNAAA